MAEWDDSYEYYAVMGRLPPPCTASPSMASPSMASQSTASPSTSGSLVFSEPRTPISSKSTEKSSHLHKVAPQIYTGSKGEISKLAKQLGSLNLGLKSGSSEVRPGFLTLNVYGPFKTNSVKEMGRISINLLAMSLYLAQVPYNNLEHLINKVSVETTWEI